MHRNSGSFNPSSYRSIVSGKNDLLVHVQRRDCWLGRNWWGCWLVRQKLHFASLANIRKAIPHSNQENPIGPAGSFLLFVNLLHQPIFVFFKLPEVQLQEVGKRSGKLGGPPLSTFLNGRTFRGISFGGLRLGPPWGLRLGGGWGLRLGPPISGPRWGCGIHKLTGFILIRHVFPVRYSRLTIFCSTENLIAAFTVFSFNRQPFAIFGMDSKQSPRRAIRQTTLNWGASRP